MTKDTSNALELDTDTLIEDIQEPVGCIGFKCPKGYGDQLFSYCYFECDDKCAPLPLLISLSSRGRTPVEGRYSVTEIGSPPQQVYLKRNYTYYVDPDNRLWATFGTAWHNVMESPRELEALGELENYITEHKFEVELGNGVLAGKVDLYEPKIKTISDYKTMKMYKAKQLKAGNYGDNSEVMQLNLYRIFGFPEAEKMKLECILKDYTTTQGARDNIRPREQIYLPKMDDEACTSIARNELNNHIECQKDPQKIRPCLNEELWYPESPRSVNYNIPVRCRDFCDVNDICPQYKEWKETHSEKPKPNKNTRGRKAKKKILPEVQQDI